MEELRKKLNWLKSTEIPYKRLKDEKPKKPIAFKNPVYMIDKKSIQKGKGKSIKRRRKQRKSKKCKR